MPRFEMHIFMVESDDDSVESSESEIICWVKDANNIKEIHHEANKVINESIHGAEKTVMFGSASIIVKGMEILNLTFKNDEMNPDEIEKVMDLFETKVETIH
jgi:hypothetical protein